MKIKIEGQELELPDTIAGDDKALKEALAPYYPGVANATIKRSAGVVEIIKQAGTKGAGAAFAALQAAPETLNFALLLAHDDGATALSEVEAEDRLLAALDEAAQSDAAGQQLRALTPAPARRVPAGF